MLEVFALTDSYLAYVRFNIGTKVAARSASRSAASQEFVDVVPAVVRSAGKVDWVEIQSFDWQTPPMVRQAYSSIIVGGFMG
ncbi:hypothetical protein [Mycobacterium lepromatosis]|uniref:hypothetical protein n=1 Tax=Mycobacterium lepromatosis TaxID=480418 RepID=UPI0012E0B2DD|nr:hypothetical protein [Mycobacterium lepromatosis]